MGTLILLTTPIGNISDMSPRGKQLLEDENLFLAEDTRSLRKLMSLLGISAEGKDIKCFNDHKQEQALGYLRPLESGQNIVLVSDAGSPIISDPAFPLVKMAIEKKYKLDSVGGISSLIMALELSGLPPNPFHFHGFIPREKGKKVNYLQGQGGVQGTHLFFEAPSRIISTIKELHEVYPDAEISVCRELTKKFQSIYHYNKNDDFESFLESIEVKGEFVLSYYLKESKSQDGAKLEALANKYLEDQKPKSLAKLIAEITGKKVQDIYNSISR